MAPFRSKELKSDWRSDFLIEETDCDCEGCGQDPCIKCGESHHNINEEVQGGVSVETYTKDTKFTEIETVNIIEPEPLKSTVNERFKFLGPGKNPDPKDMTKRKGEAVVDYTKLLVNKGKETVNPKKNEVIAASNELEGEQSLVEEVLVEDFMTDLYNEGYSVDEINEYLLEEYEIEEEYLEEAWGKVLMGLGKVAGKALGAGAKTVASRAVKDTGKTIGAAKKVAKFVTNPTNLARANKDTQKLIDTGTSIVKGAKGAMARTYDAGYKTGQLLRKPRQLPGVKTLKQLQSDIKKVNRGGSMAVMRQQIKGNIQTSNPRVQAAADRYSAKIDLPKIKSQTATATKTKVEPKLTKVKSPVKQISSSRPFKDHPTSKGLTYQQKQAKANNIIAKTQGKTPKQIKAKEVSARIEKGYNRNLEKTGDKIIKDIKATPIPKEKAIVKSPGGKMTPSPSGSLAKTTDKGSAIVANPGGKVTKGVKPNERKLSAVDRLKKSGEGTKGSGTMHASSKEPFKGVKQLSPSKKDNVKRAVAATSFAVGSAGGVEVSKKLGLINNKKEKNESFSDWRSDLGVLDESSKVMLKIGKRVWKSPGVKKFLSKVPSNLSRTTKIKPITKSHALTKQTKSFGVQPLESGRKAGERLAPDRTTLKLDSNMGRPKPKNMALNTETGDYVPKLKKSNYELVPGAKYGDKVMAKNYGQELKDKEIRKQIEALRKARNPKGIKDKSDTNQAALKTLKKSDSHK